MPIKETLQLRLAGIIDRNRVPDLTEPTSLTVDAHGNVLVCDRPGGTPTLSRLVAADGYRRQLVGTAAELGIVPLLVRVGPRDTIFVCGEIEAGSGRMGVRRLSADGRREQPYPLNGAPSDIAVDHEGKLWVIYREGSMNPTVQAMDSFARVLFDYDTAVEEAQAAEQIAPPLFMDGQYITVSPSGRVWFGGFLERASCVRLASSGEWEFWDYPTDFTDARGLIDYYGLAAPNDALLVTTDFRSPGSNEGAPKRQYLVELDLPAQRAVWHDLAALGLPDAVEPAQPSIWDLWHDPATRRLFLCDFTYHRIIVLESGLPALPDLPHLPRL